MWRYYLMLFTATFIAPLPRPVRRLCANLMAELAFAFARRSRRTTALNLRRIVPAATRRDVSRMIRESFRNLSYNYYDLTRVPYHTPSEIRDAIDFQGLEHYEAAKGMGKGVIIASAHLGNLDLVTQAFPALGVPPTMILAEMIEPPRLLALTMRLRHAQSLTFEPATATGVKSAFKALKRGEWVGVAVDRAVQGNGLVMDFLGEPALMPVGAAELALRTGATVVPSISLRAGFERHLVHIEPPIAVERERPTEERVRALSRRLLAIVERYVVEYPTQWTAVFEPVWETDKQNEQLRQRQRRAKAPAADVDAGEPANGGEPSPGPPLRERIP